MTNDAPKSNDPAPEETVVLAGSEAHSERAEALARQLGLRLVSDAQEAGSAGLTLICGDDGLSLTGGGQTLRDDFTHMLPRLRPGNLQGELIVRAARIKSEGGRALSVVDATAGFGEDSLLLAAAGHSVRLFEYNPLIAALLTDAVRRALEIPGLRDAASRMEVAECDSTSALPGLTPPPDVVVLDPMFPARAKSSLNKKKFQLLHLLELPCADEDALLRAAIGASPRRIVIKRPLKGAYLAGVKPAYSLTGKTIRYDCLTFPGTQANML